jgi:type VI secretion system protein ImpA
MSDLEDAQDRVPAWLQPLPDEAAPGGPDLEYDNDFLELTKAAAGKPESQFGPAEPPDWRAVRIGAESLLDRSRDLRLAIYWLRSGLHLMGWRALSPGLQLVNGMVDQLWDHLHPLPDPDDGDPYARVNALTLLRESEGLIGDLRATHVVQDRAIGELTGRSVELAAGLAQPVGEEAVPSKEVVKRMVAAAVERAPDLRAAVEAAVAGVRQLQTAVNQKLGSSAAPDLRPLAALVGAVAATLPEDAHAADSLDEGAAEGPGGERAGSGRGLSGTVATREEALRAIDMVCEFLERTEPTSPVPFFLRRARQLVNHNFLQLMKELAPGAMSDVANIVGIDPDSVETPTGP